MKLKKTLSLALTFSVTAALLLCSSSLADESDTELVAEAMTEAETGYETELVAEAMTEQETEDELAEAVEPDVDEYPAMTIDAIIPWAMNGGTDVLTRPLASLAQEPLGGMIEPQNMAGESGTIGTEYVYDQEADGYTILMSAENPPLYRELGLSDLTYDNFIPIIVIGDETVCIAVSAGSDYDSLETLIDAAQLAPGTIKMAGTGTGGLPWEVASMLTAVTGAEFDLVMDYDSDDAAEQAVINGECDFTACKLKAGMEDYENLQLSFLSILATEPVEGLEEVPLITDAYPAFSDYLPWGPFCGIFVKEGTDEEIVDALTEAFAAAFEDESYQEILSAAYVNPLGLSGDDASAYILDWQLKTLTAVNIGGTEE